MLRNLAIIAIAAAVVALPFIFRRHEVLTTWLPGDPELIVISPHNEAIRHEFGLAFAEWHEREYGSPARVDWRIIGGTSEIIRYLEAEFSNSFRAWRRRTGHAWPVGGADLIMDHRFDATRPPEDAELLAAWELQRNLHGDFRAIDDSNAFGSGIDIFFGGGTYDHGIAAAKGLTVRPWERGAEPVGTVRTRDGLELIPEHISGEIWRSEHFYGAAVSTFGICYNSDRLLDLGIENPPASWEDLTDPRYIHQLGIADPTKSGSIAKAFEMIIHEQCHVAVRNAGFSLQDVKRFESAISAAQRVGDAPPREVPAEYQQAIEAGWTTGLQLVQLIGANARYFTDAAGKVAVDVGSGNAAAGLVIDFFGRYQAEYSRGSYGRERMSYVTPLGGSSVSADPISLLRGAPNSETAMRFLEFVLSEDGQRLWNYRVGTPGGPRKYSLRRLPVRRDFYPSDIEAFQQRFEKHARHTVEDLADPTINPFRLAEEFEYIPRWTARLFSLHRDLIRAMCLDSGQELRAAWEAVGAAGGPKAVPEAMRALQRMPTQPEPLVWQSAQTMLSDYSRLQLMREWTIFFRNQYREARQLALEGR